MNPDAFFKELKRLVLFEPREGSHILNSEGCEYGEHIYFSKNLYYAFDCLKSIDSSYLYDCIMCNNCLDCDYCFESELLYESVDAHKCFNSDFLQDCINVRDSSFCNALIDCHDMFGCTHLRNKSFCIFNRQLTQDQYQILLPKFKALPAQHVLAYLEQLKKMYPLTQTHELNNQNSPYGNYVYNCKNCYMCFDISQTQESAYMYDSSVNKTCMDVTYSTENELCYQVADSAHCFNSDYIVYSAHCQDSSYLLNCFGVKNSLGCVGLNHKQYFILNRPFSKEEYERLSAQILGQIRGNRSDWSDLSY